MKFIKSAKFVFPFLVLSFFFFSACQDDSVNSPSEQTDFNTSEFAILDYDDAMNTVQGGTMDDGFNISSFNPTGNVGGPGLRGNHRHLGRILWLLELTDDQRENVRLFIEQNHECMRSSFEEFKAAVEPILQAANEERKAIIEQLRNGDITNAEAYFLLKELRENTRNTIENDPGVIAAKQSICDCKISLLENIGSILAEEQSVIWDDWYSNLNGPCFE